MHHHHHHDTASERIGWAFFLNLCFTVIEFIGGVLTNSTAILADAVHDLGDSISIGMAWLLDKFSRKDATNTFTYGYRRLSLVGAFINAVILTAGSIWILFEAIPRLWNPVMPMAEGMALLAVFGVIVNGYAAFKLSKGQSLNERVLNWHLLEDVLGWVAVLVVSIVLLFVDWPILDPLLSIAFTLFILVNVIRHLGSTIKLFVQASPDPEIYQQIHKKLVALDLVDNAHHLHFWSLDGERHVLTAHIVVSKELTSTERAVLKEKISEQLAEFELAHTTIELEYPDEACRDH
ncbi:cobalt transporter [Idiomarina sp. WRN-38]|uniref:cation diffusion facilitator family transporter n=1 Tax=Idiomarina sp. OXR-189 TaxID=3100175 RepID=UPI00073358BC|nr:cation diffusion facilitator family transporter [Idiomarina sp. OXR-189]KTG28704.1 cobalt transporter [Idiomarina sp. H105]OAF09469.1 cobalt transporter [Idiomarina sp. WRN-38]WPZ01338.1 cation diffusion facilitator family transporter [Idiomarina sp. OXR-189]|tara:strand:- start:831 stop:1706 length:876 start_codon:yes stop_codon:yes gene_type:complete